MLHAYLLKAGFFTDKASCSKSEKIIGYFGAIVNLLSGIILLFTDAEDDSNGLHIFATVELILIGILYLYVVFFTAIDSYVMSLSWFQTSEHSESSNHQP